MTPAPCRHCGRAKVNRPRGLCWTCYYTPGVKERHPNPSKFARRGVGNLTGNRPDPAGPTSARPGTAEKLAVLAERAKDGVNLWHPDDVTLTPDPEPATGEPEEEPADDW